MWVTVFYCTEIRNSWYSDSDRDQSASVSQLQLVFNMLHVLSSKAASWEPQETRRVGLLFVSFGAPYSDLRGRPRTRLPQKVYGNSHRFQRGSAGRFWPWKELVSFSVHTVEVQPDHRRIFYPLKSYKKFAIRQWPWFGRILDWSTCKQTHIPMYYLVDIYLV